MIAVRDADDGPEVLVLERSSGSRFLPGYVVFPGGAVDAGDEGLAQAWFGSAAEAARAAAVRELAEEAGLALTATGLALADPGDPMAALAASPPNRDQLAEVAHWVAPEEVPVRFDARYYAVASPLGLDPVPDGQEAVQRVVGGAARPARRVGGRRPQALLAHLLHGASPGRVRYRRKNSAPGGSRRANPTTTSSTASRGRSSGRTEDAARRPGPGAEPVGVHVGGHQHLGGGRGPRGRDRPRSPRPGAPRRGGEGGRPRGRGPRHARPPRSRARRADVRPARGRAAARVPPGRRRAPARRRADRGGRDGVRGRAHAGPLVGSRGLPSPRGRRALHRRRGARAGHELHRPARRRPRAVPAVAQAHAGPGAEDPLPGPRPGGAARPPRSFRSTSSTGPSARSRCWPPWRTGRARSCRWSRRSTRTTRRRCTRSRRAPCWRTC